MPSWRLRVRTLARPILKVFKKRDVLTLHLQIVRLSSVLTKGLAVGRLTTLHLLILWEAEEHTLFAKS